MDFTVFVVIFFLFFNFFHIFAVGETRSINLRTGLSVMCVSGCVVDGVADGEEIA